MVGPLFALACLLANVPLKGSVSRDCGVRQLTARLQCAEGAHPAPSHRDRGAHCVSKS